MREVRSEKSYVAFIFDDELRNSRSARAIRLAPDDADQLAGGWQPSSLFLRINLLAFQEHIQSARTSHLQPHGNSKLSFNRRFEAHGLNLDIASDEAALDFDRHMPDLARKSQLHFIALRVHPI